ncbi:Helix-hairpin-helix containing domain-containing protein [Streptomyces zhaozhouensis]|uniref:Helix-hairpin-helix containing domain-containing protein n=1 Tax=Streptomyces zhaozhouensis TaxID=1300267 RepID=A0A286DSB1_9ACTN|nr:ATP-binding domain-containing protein [Streptomyces zhaozhouensis]SOD61538.1 Helix-hairpin-helix containing domain-containing protein [Streptomyces zhaozhouensis]
MTSEHATPAADPAAELRAAVRAVESGERSAASFYHRPEPPRAPAPQARRGPARPPAAEAAVPVPDGLPGLLAAGGAPEALAPRVAAALGEDAERELRADPWRLLATPGVAPRQADEFARALLGDEAGPGDARRGQALVGWLLERAALAGHTALEPGRLASGLAEHAVPEPEEAVRTAIEEGAVLVFRDRDAPLDGPAAEGEEAEARLLVGLERYAMAEEGLADGLGRLRGTFVAPGGEAAEGWAAAAAEAPSPSAAELIRAAGEAAVVTHTGGEAARAEPLALALAAGRLGLRAAVAAHQPDGRRRLASALGERAPVEAVTVSGLLEGREGPERDGEGRFPWDLLVVVDAERLAAEPAAALVESLPDGARLVLSGDPLLLGSAGPGQVLADVLASGRFPRVVSRTPDPGPVGELVSGIGVGELASVEAPDREVVIVPVADPGEAVHRTVQLVTESIPRAFELGAEQVRVIVPAHGGPAGTRALNAALKARLNAGPGAFGGFDPGDLAAHSPAPGQLRLVRVVEADERGLWVEDEDGRFVVPRERVAETLRHGWAVTAHQAAGLRWPAVVAVLPGDAAGALDRRWVYTAFGRAARHLSVVQGCGPALERAVAAPPAGERETRLRALVREQPQAPPAG